MGHVNQRGRDRWEVRVELGVDPLTGKRSRIIRQVKGKKRDALAELNRLEHEVETGTYTPPSSLTVGAYLTQWLTYMQAQLAPAAYARYRGIVEQHIIPALGSVNLQKLHPAHIIDAEAAWAAHGRLKRNGERSGRQLSAKTVLNHHRVLHKALEDAVIVYKVLRVNPCDAIRSPRWDKRPVARLTRDEAMRLADVLEADDYGPALFTLLYTGLRVGEVIGLRWREDVDLSTRRLSVQQQWDDKAKTFRDTKSHRATRPVSLDTDLSNVLERWRVRQKEWRLAAGPVWEDVDNTLVFTTRAGEHLTPSMMRRALDRCLASAGVRYVTRHGLRHTHATLMVSAGIHMRVLQERLGHATFATTADIYSHLDSGIQEQAAEQFSESLRRRRG
jgi:integrase